jgi:hypothetical protein
MVARGLVSGALEGFRSSPKKETRLDAFAGLRGSSCPLDVIRVRSSHWNYWMCRPLYVSPVRLTFKSLLVIRFMVEFFDPAGESGSCKTSESAWSLWSLKSSLALPDCMS